MAGSLAGMLAARTGLSPVMVGRATELGACASSPPPPEEPAVALISGEAGIGKTRLVAELIAILDSAFGVLVGQGSQGRHCRAVHYPILWTCRSMGMNPYVAMGSGGTCGCRGL